MNRQRRPSGFTVIEMVIAIALAVSMIVSVYSATRAMSDTAQRQKDLSLQNLRRQRFADILRRDLRGWVVQAQSGAMTAPAPAGAQTQSDETQSLLQFNTTTDSLASAIQTGSSDAMRGITNLQYALRKNGDNSEIVRIEVGGNACELALLQSTHALKIEFFDGTKWASQWSGKQRPALIRVTVEGRVNVIGL